MIGRYQEVLGLDPGGHYSNKDYKKAYKKMALKHHPDQGGDESKFKEITEAYEILSGKRNSTSQQPNQGFGFDFRDIFDSINYQYASRAHRVNKPPEREEDISLGLNLTIADIKNGKQFEIEYKKSKPCDKCNGVGGNEKTKCEICKGFGVVRQTQKKGNMSFSTQFPCPECRGAGAKIKEPCDICEAKGFTIQTENLKFEIKERE